MKCSLGVRGNKDTLALSEQVTCQIGNGVRFAGSRWPLDHYPTLSRHPIHDGALLFVGRKREIQLGVLESEFGSVGAAVGLA